MNRYVVQCDCVENRRTVAWVDDERPDGRVRVRSNTSFTAVARVANKRGGMINYTIHCKVCGKKVTLSETTVGDIIDMLAPSRDALEVASIPAFDQMLVPLGKPAPEVIRYESRYVIPLIMLCKIVSRGGITE